MSFVMLTSEDDGLDLGPTLDVLHFFQRIARLSPDMEFGYLHGIPHHVPDVFSARDMALISNQARSFLEHYASEITEFDRAVLERLASAAPICSWGHRLLDRLSALRR